MTHRPRIYRKNSSYVCHSGVTPEFRVDLANLNRKLSLDAGIRRHDGRENRGLKPALRIRGKEPEMFASQTTN